MMAKTRGPEPDDRPAQGSDGKVDRFVYAGDLTEEQV